MVDAAVAAVRRCVEAESKGEIGLRGRVWVGSDDDNNNVPFCPHGCFASMRPVVFLYKGTRRNFQAA